MKLIIYIFTIICLSGLCSCNLKDSNVGVISEKTYSENERFFIDNYNKVKEDYDKSKPMKKPSRDPSSCDFAVIDLNREYYGVEQFAFLPIDSRQLTEEEMLQMVYVYDGIAPELILDNMCYYKKENQIEGENLSTRELSAKENFKLQIELLDEYFNKGLRKKEEIGNETNKGYPFCITLNNKEQFWIYPKKEMTEEQLLEIINLKYQDVPKDWYTPNSTQISYEKIGSKIDAILQKYIISNKKPTNIYALYQSIKPEKEKIPNSLQRREDIWNVYLHFNNGKYDYGVNIKAEDGSLLKWMRYPKNFYSPKGYFMENLKTTTDGINTKEEEWKNAAENYINETLSNETVFITGEILVEQSNKNDLYSKVMISMSDNKRYNIYIDKLDLSISGLELLL